jgi:Protein of unknown function (DUF3015)
MAYGNPTQALAVGWANSSSQIKRQKDIAPQVLMATTNGTFGSQTFGLSTGNIRLHE